MIGLRNFKTIFKPIPKYNFPIFYYVCTHVTPPLFACLFFHMNKPQKAIIVKMSFRVFFERQTEIKKGWHHHHPKNDENRKKYYITRRLKKSVVPDVTQRKLINQLLHHPKMILVFSTWQFRQSID